MVCACFEGTTQLGRKDSLRIDQITNKEIEKASPERSFLCHDHRDPTRDTTRAARDAPPFHVT
jgi:hypothetical protein